jgi:hypothetical protein
MRLRYKRILGYLLVTLLVGVVTYVAVRIPTATRTTSTIIDTETMPTLEALAQLRFAGLRIVASTNELALVTAERLASATVREGKDEEGEESKQEEIEDKDEAGNDEPEKRDAEETEG